MNSSFERNKHENTVNPQFIKEGNPSYLNSYKMQDNPYYNSISYTLLILYQTMIEHRNLGMQS